MGDMRQRRKEKAREVWREERVRDEERERERERNKRKKR